MILLTQQSRKNTKLTENKSVVSKETDCKGAWKTFLGWCTYSRSWLYWLQDCIFVKTIKTYAKLEGLLNVSYTWIKRDFFLEKREKRKTGKKNWGTNSEIHHLQMIFIVGNLKWKDKETVIKQISGTEEYGVLNA